MPANIILTYRCPNRCPYCFAEGTRSRPTLEMTTQEFDYYLGFLKRSHNNRPQLIGGEPFLHPLALQFIGKVLDDPFFRMLSIFTSGFVHPRYHAILRNSRVRLLVNVNSPADYPPGVFDKLTRRLEELAALPVRLAIGFNIYREDFDYLPVIQLAHRLGSQMLRWSLASPCADGPTQHLDRPGRRRAVPRLLQFLEACNEGDLEPHMDCPVEPCLFDDEQLGRMCRLLPRGTKLWPVDCQPPLDLGPGYRAYRCLALGEAFAVDVRKFATEQELKQHFVGVCDRRRCQAAPAECHQCDYFFRGDCGGGCLGLMHARLTAPPDDASDSTSPASILALCRRAQELCLADDPEPFVRHMNEHARALKSVNTLRMQLLWADYFRIRKQTASAERHLLQAIPLADEVEARRIRALLDGLRAAPHIASPISQAVVP